MTASQAHPENIQQQALLEEWKSLQHSYDRYEGLGLHIKILAFIVWIACTVFTMNTLVILLTMSLIWFQEAIWKTFQSRTEDRLIDLENAWKNLNAEDSLSFYTNWQKRRPGSAALITAYIKSAMRPTIAYPYILLIIITLIV